MSKLSTIIHWFLTRWGDAVDRQDYVRAEKVKNTAKKHLEALLKEEYKRGYKEGWNKSAVFNNTPVIEKE